MKSFHFDEVDRRLLQALQERGDESQESLARRVGSSPASCWRRVKALEAAGVLLKNVRLVDPEKVGRAVNVICQVRLSSHAPEMRTSFEQVLMTRGQVTEVYSMTGEWDYLLRIVVANVTEYEQFLMQDVLRHPAVATAASHFALRQIKYTTAIPI